MVLDAVFIYLFVALDCSVAYFITGIRRVSLGLKTRSLCWGHLLPEGGFILNFPAAS